jgi:hypothetical protein
MPLISRLITILLAVTGLAAPAHAGDRESLTGHQAKSPAITASFLDGIVPEIVTSAAPSPVPSKTKAKPKRSQSRLTGGDPIGRIIALRTGRGVDFR